jgi:hypothetical protein
LTFPRARRNIPRMSKVLGLAVVGVGGYFAYSEIVKPYLAQKRLEAMARAESAKTGKPYAAALASLGAKACGAAVTAYGVPPNPVSGAACELAGTVAAKLILEGGPLAIKGLKVGAKGAAVAAKVAFVSPAKSVARGAKSAAKKLKFWGLEGLHC